MEVVDVNPEFPDQWNSRKISGTTYWDGNPKKVPNLIELPEKRNC